MNTNNASSFFQSADAQEKFDRQASKSTNTLGRPLTFPTKLLHVSNDLDSEQYVLLAESGSIARRIDCDSGMTVAVYRGHSAPVTCVRDLQSGRVATSSWDKTVRIHHKHTRECLAVLQGHTDFVKCLLYIPHTEVLLSGSSDSHIRVYSTVGWEYMYTLKGHTRGVECMTVGGEGDVYSAGSESRVRTWQVRRESGTQIGEPQVLHETSVYALHYDAGTESLWTGSADGTAKQWSVMEPGVMREEAVFQHTDYVRDVLVYRDWLITACRDEDVRVWEIASGKLAYTLQGHFSEVSSLCIVGETLISCSLDATVRRWTLTRQGLEEHVKQQMAWQPNVKKETSVEDGMTADELAELEELMADD